jgi:hypothetical protein
MSRLSGSRVYAILTRGGRSTALFEFLAVCALAAHIIWPLFSIEYLAFWDSIDSTFIADARYLVEHWPHPEWQPNWYTGTRFDYIYPPGLRYGTAALSMLLDVSTARGYHLFTAIMYCIGIGAVYVLVRYGSGSRAWAWIVAIAVTTVSPSYMFLDRYYRDYTSVRHMPLRLGVLIHWGEGPHSSAYAILPLALAAAWFGLRRKQPIALALAALSSTALVLTNFYGATALAMFFPVLAWSIFVTERDWFVWLRAAGIAALSYGLAAFWLTPTYLQITLRNMQLVSNPGNTWSIWVGLATVALVGLVSFKLAWGKPERAYATFCFGGLTIMGVNVLGNYYKDFRIIGEPLRLVPEFDMVFLMAAAIPLAVFWNKNLVGKAAVVLILMAAIYPSKGWLRRSWQFFPVDTNPTARIEFKLTKWMHENLPDVRALATGSVRFWYNAWYTLPQLGGGSEQGLINLTANDGHAQIVGDNPAEVSIRWAQCLGVGALIVHDETSQEKYHDYAKPERFRILKALYDDKAGNWVYEVPRRYPERARVVNGEGVRSLGIADRIINLDLQQKYLDLIENTPSPRVTMQRPSAEEIRLQAQIESGQALLVQETFDPAWHAYSAGKSVPITIDYMGFMLLNPGPGSHDIQLRFETPFENQVGKAATAFSGLIFAGLIAIGLRREIKA